MSRSVAAYEAPHNWATTRLKFVGELSSSGVWGDDPTGVDDYPVVTTANIDRLGRINLAGIALRRLSEDDAANGLCQVGDIIVVKSSGSATNIVSGKAGLVEPTHLPIAFNNFTLRFRPTREVMQPRFLWYFLNSEIVKEQIRIMVATTTYPNLQVDEYSSFLVPMPPTLVQEFIVGFLNRETERLDALVAAKQRVLDLLAERRKAIIATAVTRGLDAKVKLRDSGVPWLGEIPTHWKAERVRWHFRERDQRGRPDLPLMEVSISRGVSVREFSDERIEATASDFNTYKVARKGDIAFNKMRMWQGAVGVAPTDGLVSPDYVVAEPTGSVLPDFAGLLFRVDEFSAECGRRSHGLTWDRLRIYWEEFREIEIPIPPLPEQAAIVAHVALEAARVDAVRAATERTIDLLKERRAALIAAAVTGQLDLRMAA